MLSDAVIAVLEKMTGLHLWMVAAKPRMTESSAPSTSIFRTSGASFSSSPILIGASNSRNAMSRPRIAKRSLTQGASNAVGFIETNYVFRQQPSSDLESRETGAGVQ